MQLFSIHILIDRAVPESLRSWKICRNIPGFLANTKQICKICNYRMCSYVIEKVVQRSSCQTSFATTFCHTGSPRVSSACNAEGSRLDLKNVPWYSATPLNTKSKHLESTYVRILWKNTCHTISLISQQKKMPRFLFLLSLSPGFQTHVRQQNSLCPRHQDIVQLRLLTSYHQSFPPPQTYHCAAHILSFPTKKLSHTLPSQDCQLIFCFISSTLSTLQELTYPPKMGFWRWCSFSQGGMC